MFHFFIRPGAYVTGQNEIQVLFNQRAKKVVSNSPGLVDFAIGL